MASCKKNLILHYMKSQLIHFAARENPYSGFENRFETNRTVKPQTIARGLNFGFLK